MTIQRYEDLEIWKNVYTQSTQILFNRVKEANETDYWTCLLRDSNFISQNTASELLSDCTEIIKILTSSIKTAKSNLK
jgi:four helix bundle protein